MAPPGVQPGWNWLPPEHGVRPALERVPWWVRAWLRIPLVDRYAYVHLWRNGGLELLPADPDPGPGAASGVRVPPRPEPPVRASSARVEP